MTIFLLIDSILNKQKNVVKAEAEQKVAQSTFIFNNWKKTNLPYVFLAEIYFVEATHLTSKAI